MNTETKIAITGEKSKVNESLLQENKICIHCGLPSAEIFCCIGCKTIYETIQELGLSHFYDLRTNPYRPETKTLSANTLEAFDYPEVQDQFFQKNDPSSPYLTGMLVLEGIHCSGCVWMLEELPRLIEGIRSSRVDLGQGIISLQFDPDKIKLSQIASSINRLGYSVSISSSQKTYHRKELIRLGVTALCASNTMMLAVSLWQGIFSSMEKQYSLLLLYVSFILTIPAVTYGAYPFYRNAYTSLRRGRFHIDLPLSIALIGAFVASSANMILSRNIVYFDSVCLLTFLLLAGRYIQTRALSKAQIRSKTAWSMLPFTSRLVNNNDSYTMVSTDSVLPGQLVEVRTGERIPIDGVIVRGEGSINISVLTGESLPQNASIGTDVFASTLLTDGLIVISSTSIPMKTRMHQILSKLETLPDSQPKVVSLTERLSFYFVLAVLLLATITFTYWLNTSLEHAIDNTVALLIVSCPCALGIAIPLIIARANGALAEQGVLVKRSSVFESLCNSHEVFLDKTGTITTGHLSIASKLPKLMREDEEALRELLYKSSFHPVIEGLKKIFKEPLSSSLNTVKTTTGKGVSVSLGNGTHYYLGSEKWLNTFLEHPVTPQQSEIVGAGTCVYFWKRYESSTSVLAQFQLQDTLRLGIDSFISLLNSKGKKIHILSGDTKEHCERVAQSIKIPNHSILFEMSPEAKNEIITNAKVDTIMIGDGVNDSMALKASTVGIGFQGSLEASMESCDIYLSAPSFEILNELFTYAYQIKNLIFKTIIVGTMYNVIFAPMAMFGYINPVIAAFVMPLSSLSVITLSIVGTRMKKRVSN
jgi:Cu2+-exporting ATPase